MSDTLTKDFRAWLAIQPAIKSLVGGAVCEAWVNDTDASEYVLFNQTGSLEDIDLDGVGGHVVTNIDVECRAKSLGKADQIATEVKRLVNGFPQSRLVGEQRKWNGRVIQFAQVTDHSKDYEILPVGSFETDQIHALILEVHSDG